MSNRLRRPEKGRPHLLHPKPTPTRSHQRQTAAVKQPPPAKPIWIIGALGGLLLLAILVSAFSAWMILRHR